MSTDDLTLDLLAYHSFPLLASALTLRKDSILLEWESAVALTLPAADALTLKSLRDSVPLILQEIIDAFASDQPVATRDLVEGSKLHGESRFQENYNMRELVVEYRLLRRVIIQQISEELDERLDVRNNIALNMAVDTALQSGIVMFTEHLQQQISASTEVQSKYLSFLSHDLRNHLHHALLHIQLLAMRLAKIPEYASSAVDLESVKQAILQTTMGMDRLLQCEQLRKTDVPHVAEPVDLNSLLPQVVNQLAHEAKSKGLALELDVPADAQTVSDESLLTLVLQNLLGNAIKYSSRGRIKVTARNNSNREGIGWELSISDQGPGIGAEDLTHLFDAFRRGDTYGKPGVGLGLSIATEATRLLGGKLEIDSKVGVGSTFKLMLPDQASKNKM
ncbi:HAMP domain-containing sensor histidine kinase [Nitrosovibrio sp. Nv6]|uniref:sensor histidine kinase n=1 Tax=Nitrosovibrio sp. Nv6 TaxID=1855340 RepID=UPI0008B082C7|nr:HAMP domain-containing sensor histidine kinase [Nitrosovibrio sp. Nv6]SEP01681.1 Signal transduction histidine kinase [Nitrosovibrio sp. Nv6]